MWVRFVFPAGPETCTAQLVRFVRLAHRYAYPHIYIYICIHTCEYMCYRTEHRTNCRNRVRCKHKFLERMQELSVEHGTWHSNGITTALDVRVCLSACVCGCSACLYVLGELHSFVVANSGSSTQKRIHESTIQEDGCARLRVRRVCVCAFSCVCMHVASCA